VEGLRERKKRETRELISGVATRLFVLRGFDNVTVAEVAEAANVSKMTVFNYFPRKEDLFFDAQDVAAQLLREVIEQRPPGTSVLAALRAKLLELAATRDRFGGVRDGVHHFWQTVWDSPALLARAREMADELQRELTAALATGPDDLQAEVVAGVLVVAFRSLYLSALRRLAAGDTADEIYPDHVRAINETFDLLESGLGGFGAR
jgi:AcrR family transcriptional regulator